MRSSNANYDDVDIDGSERNSISLSVINDSSNSSKDNIDKLSDLLLHYTNSRFIRMEKGVTEVSKEMWKKDLIGLYSHYALVGFVQGITITITITITIIITITNTITITITIIITITITLLQIQLQIMS